MKKNNILLLLLMLLLSFDAAAQLPAFNLSVTAVDETCTGNGELHITVTNTAADATMFYSVYKSPDFTNPLLVSNTTTILGLASGMYRVVALQSLGSESNTQSFDIAIADNRQALVYQAVAQPLNCISGNIAVAVSQGNPATYEIIAGPILVPPQTSNVLTNLPLGEYTVKVTDACGDAIVQSCTLTYVFSPMNLEMPQTATQQCELVDCDTASIRFNLRASTGQIIAYPFHFTITVYPPGGGTPTVIEQDVASGGLNNQFFDFNIPFSEVTGTSITIKITDPCGNVTEGSVIPVFLNNSTTLELGNQPDNICEKQIRVYTCNMKYPIQVSFLQTPPGFDPTVFNAQHPGPFNADAIIYSGDATTEIPDGNYTVMVTDACGRTFQDTIEVKESEIKVVVNVERSYYDNCLLCYPVEIGIQGLAPVTVIVTNAPAGFGQTMPYDYSFAISPTGEFNEPFCIPGDYTVTGIDICGNPYIKHFTIPGIEIATEVYPFASNGCGPNGSVRIFNISAPPMLAVMVIAAPTSYEHALPYNIGEQMDIPPAEPANDFLFRYLNPGDYTFVITDVCGNVYDTIHFNIPQILFPGPPDFSVLEGCDVGKGSIKVSYPSGSNVSLEFIEITAAPPTFTHPLPYNISFNIHIGILTMNTLPEGDYSFRARDTCGVESTFSLTIGNHFFDTTVEPDGNCGSFNLFLHNSAPPFISGPVYVLHQYNPVTGGWTHPLTGYPFQTGSFPNGQNSYFLTDNNYNIAAQGKFRVLKINYIYPNGSNNTAQLIPCLNLLDEFEFNGMLRITDAYKIACTQGNSQVTIVAGDNSPLTYEIIEKNGQPFYVNNQQSSLFTQLEPALYKFQVKDLCGNIVTRIFDVNALSEPVIIASELCDGQQGELNVPSFSFLNYQWWKADNPSVILSTTSTLHFSPFLMNSTPGTYYVRIYSDSVLSCADMTIAYTIPVVNDPRAGNDNNLILCSDATVDLNTLLSGLFDTNGVWAETTTSGMLNGHHWVPVGLAPGVYQFTYTVNGFCQTSDQAVFEITLRENMPVPVATVTSGFCLGEPVVFNVETIPNAAYAWNGPNDFTSTQQNPMIPNGSSIHNGTYTVTATRDGCQSTTTVDVNLFPAPNYSLQAGCVGGVYRISVIPKDDIQYTNYLWTGPNGFASQQSTIILTNGAVGLYKVEVTNVDGCSKEQSIVVNSTVCGIPNVITPNDGDNINQSFDLSAYDVNKLEIYNRWGRIVYDQNNYTDQWHGQNNHGKELSDSTYYYIIYLRSGEEKQGWVYKTPWQ